MLSKNLMNVKAVETSSWLVQILISKGDISNILAQKSYVTFSFRLIVTLENTCDSSQWLCVNFCVVISVAVRTRPLMEKHTL